MQKSSRRQNSDGARSPKDYQAPLLGKSLDMTPTHKQSAQTTATCNIGRSDSLADRKMAPVLVSVYDRRKHLGMCIEALKKNPEAKDTPLYIVSDGWQHEGHRKAIEEVRKYIGTITGFKEVHTRFREKNWGMRASAMDATEWVLSKHDHIIRMEDDIICSPHYLRFLNGALSAYKNDPRVFCICAHTHPKYKPPRNYPHDIFLSRSFSPWGCAFWKDQQKEFLRETEAERKELTRSAIWKAYCKNTPTVTSRKNYIGGMLHNDARINLHMFLKDKYAVYPNTALSINIGLDGSGAHCGLGWTYPKQLLLDTPIQLPDSLEPSLVVHRKLYRAQYSLLHHGIGGILRSMGCFDTLYAVCRRMFGFSPK